MLWTFYPVTGLMTQVNSFFSTDYVLSFPDGSNRLDWARNWIVKYFEVKRSKLIRRNPDILFDDLDLYTNSSSSTTNKPLINILDVGSCNGLMGSELKLENFGIRTISIDIAPANESVYLCDFSSVKIGLPKESDIIEIEKDSNFCQKISMFKTSSFDQICFLYVLRKPVTDKAIILF